MQLSQCYRICSSDKSIMYMPKEFSKIRSCFRLSQNMLTIKAVLCFDSMYAVA